MIIKLDNSIFTFPTQATPEITEVVSKPLTFQERVNLDRIVIAVLFVVAIVGALLF